MKHEEKTYANVASVCPSMIMDGLEPSVASQSSVTNDPHIRIIAVGEHFISTTPTHAAESFG